MKNFIIIFIFIFFSNCSKPQTVVICGDHACINKAEAEQYFEDNLTIEVKILDQKQNKQVDLVELNLKSKKDEKKKVSIIKKKQTKENLKILSNKEIEEKKAQIQLREKKDKKELKAVKKVNKNRSNKIINTKSESNVKTKKVVNKPNKEMIDICTILEKCSIDEISKFLIEKGNKKKFPDLTKKE